MGGNLKSLVWPSAQLAVGVSSSVAAIPTVARAVAACCRKLLLDEKNTPVVVSPDSACADGERLNEWRVGGCDCDAATTDLVVVEGAKASIIEEHDAANKQRRRTTTTFRSILVFARSRQCGGTRLPQTTGYREGATDRKGSLPWYRSQAKVVKRKAERRHIIVSDGLNEKDRETHPRRIAAIRAGRFGTAGAQAGARPKPGYRHSPSLTL